MMNEFEIDPRYQQPDISHKIAQKIYALSYKIKTVEDMAEIIRKEIKPLEDQLEKLNDLIDCLPIDIDDVIDND